MWLGGGISNYRRSMSKTRLDAINLYLYKNRNDFEALDEVLDLLSCYEDIGIRLSDIGYPQMIYFNKGNNNDINIEKM